MLMWCTLHVFILCATNTVCSVETAVKGKVVNQQDFGYINLDFSEYAKKQKYVGNYSNVFVRKDNCIEDEK